MQTRRLGAQGDSLPEVGLGCMGMSSVYTETDDTAAQRVIERAYELGVRHFDTADVYGPDGHNERLLGRAVRRFRDDVLVATKFGQVILEDGSRVIDGSPEYVRAACDASLARLGTDWIDLYTAHRIDPKVPVEETVGAMAGLVGEGKVRHIGLSEAAPASLRRGHATHPVAALQLEYSLWTRFAEEEHLPLCDELGVAFVAYAPMGRGFLSGTIKASGDIRPGDRRHRHPRFAGDNLDSNVALLQTLTDVAVEVGAAPAQVALAWVLAQRPFIHVIPGTTSETHLEENIAATDIALSADQLHRLAEAFTNVSGDRYPPAAAQHVQR